MRNKWALLAVSSFGLAVSIWIVLGYPGLRLSPDQLPWLASLLVAMYPTGGMVLCLTSLIASFHAVSVLAKRHKLLRSGPHDPWDKKDRPVQHGPWRPGDD